MKAEEQQESVLNSQAALLAWLQQGAPYGVITLDPLCVVQSWNHWMEVHTSVRMENAVGQNIFTLFPGLEQRRLAGPFDRALKGESSVLSTTLHHYLLPMPSPGHVAGSLMRQTARIAPLVSEGKICGIVIVIEDVTQREDQSEALLQQHRRQEILSWTSAHLLKSDRPWKTIRQLFFKIAEHLDFDSFFLYVRDAETNALGLYTTGGIAPDLEAGFANYSLFQNVVEAQEAVAFESFQSNAEPRYELLRKAAIRAAVAIPLLANKRSLGVLCFGTSSRDRIAPAELDLLATIAQYLAISVDRERANHQLERAKEQLSEHAHLLEKKVQERTARLRETISELEVFSYTLAHDLKAPIRAMLEYCRMLSEDFSAVMPREAAEIVGRLQRPSKRMHALILDLLEFSKVSRQELAFSRVDLEPIVRDVLALSALEATGSVTLCTPLPAVLGHKDLLCQVLGNLVDNAAKFVKPNTRPRITIYGEVVDHSTPSARASSLLFSAADSLPVEAAAPVGNRVVRIWVKDEGIGIRPELRQKIFGIFERGVDSDAYEGTGMGLAIVARAMQRMGGTYGMESTLGQGSQFWIELPAP